MRELPGKGVGGCMENLALTASDWSAGLRGRWIWHKETETELADNNFNLENYYTLYIECAHRALLIQSSDMD